MMGMDGEHICVRFEWEGGVVFPWWNEHGAFVLWMTNEDDVCVLYARCRMRQIACGMWRRKPG